jgi:uncharacterized damage-inducible protein DinB
MQFSSTIERHLAYDHWANGQSLASLEKLPAPPKQAVDLLAHLLGAEMCWIKRMTEGRDAPGIEAWDSMQTLASLRVFWQDELPAMWKTFLADKTLSDPSRTFTVVDFAGNTSRPIRVEDALLHVLYHSPHHRGQVAALVRAAGGEPAPMEFLRAERAGAV